MGKKVLVVSSTLRNGGNSLALAEAFASGARESGNDVEFVSLKNKDIRFCTGCLTCQKTHKCPIPDDVSKIIDLMRVSDVLAFATPVYFYGISGQLKTFLDRTNPIFSSKYNFRDIYLLGAAADADEGAIDGAITALNGWISCFNGTKLKGVVCGAGATDVGEISADKLKEAMDMGKSV